MTPRSYGMLPSGDPVEAYILSNTAGASMEVLSYGGIVTSLRLPDREGRCDDVVLGFEDLASYLAGTGYFGAIIGRIAGRVGAGRILVDGQAHVLTCNEGHNHLHGGLIGLDKRMWSVQPQTRADGAASVRLTYKSPDGEEGYPGNAALAVTYTLTSTNEFVVETEAAADRATPLALTHHSYFNLAGAGSSTIEDHEVQIFAASSVPVGDDLLLSGQREAVAGRAVDFSQPRRLRDALPELFQAHGDFYPLRQPGAAPPACPTLAARVVEPRSGRVLEVFTDEFCLQFYTGSALDSTPLGKRGAAYGPYAGLCLECQGYPGGGNPTEFGDALVRPGHPQFRRTIYAFSIVKPTLP